MRVQRSNKRLWLSKPDQSVIIRHDPVSAEESNEAWRNLSDITDQDDEVRAALGRIPGLAATGKAWAVTRLPSLTNRTFRVARGSDAYVLRLPGRGTERYIDRVAEAANARAAAAIGLSPEIVFADPGSGLLLSRYVADAVPLSAERLREETDFRNTILLLQSLHHSGLVFQGRMWLYEKLDDYLAMAGASAPRARELRALRVHGERLRPLLAPGWGPERPCHIDPAPHNFIVARGRTFLLDWEYSAMCEPLWDLAGLSIEGAFDAGQDESMLNIYFGRAEHPWASRLHLYKIMLRLLAAAWAAVQLVDGNGDGQARELLQSLTCRAAEDLAARDLDRHIAAAA
jgi:thiamine kinase-like enzyme